MTLRERARENVCVEGVYEQCRECSTLVRVQPRVSGVCGRVALRQVLKYYTKKVVDAVTIIDRQANTHRTRPDADACVPPRLAATVLKPDTIIHPLDHFYTT